MRINARMTVLAALAAAFGAGFAARAEDNARQRPNVVLIVSDDQGLADLSCCGAKRIRTPHLDRLMGSGIRLTRFYASSALCSPTRAALMTGWYPDMAAPLGNDPEQGKRRLAPFAVPLPQSLKRAGYRTALVGKWHLGETSPSLPQENGFDEFWGFPGPMLKSYFTHAKQKGTAKGLWHNAEPLAVEGHATDLFTGWAVDFIRDEAARGNPFFLYLPYNAPHSPLEARPDWLERVRRRFPDLKEGPANSIGLVEHLDESVGRVVEAIRTAGVSDRTLVIFTSDNGGRRGLTEPAGLRGGKGELYEGGLRVPCCAVWPGRIAAGSQSARLALSMDLYPTICEAAGAAYDAAMPAKSLLPTLLGKAQPADERILVFTVPAGKTAGALAKLPLYACRQGDWKIVQSAPRAPMELYNLKDDPGEENPLPTTLEAYGRLQEALQQHLLRAKVLRQSVGKEER